MGCRSTLNGDDFDDEAKPADTIVGAERQSKVEQRTARNYAVIKQEWELGELSFPAAQEPTSTHYK